MTKEKFLERYNKSKSQEEALSKSISAAVQHNKIYNDVDSKDRIIIREYWSSQLVDLAERYKVECWSDDSYEQEVQGLKEKMKARFPEIIDFRISHAQKSLSVFLKHMWCLGLAPTPPQCPVDRIILTNAKAPYNKRSWGYVDSITEHKVLYDIIKQAAYQSGYTDVALWELENFN